MSAWLRPLRAALDAAPEPVTIFFRDDDAGWADDRLAALLDRFAAHGTPIDLAAIPADMTQPLADALVARADAGEPVGIHQHGYAHTNHQIEGRKCEFGSARDKAAQREDIARGQGELQALLGDRLDPFFTPPWNRCTRDTAESLIGLGFTLLSREHKAEPFGLLPELPVHLDVARLTPQELDERFAGHIADGGPVGVMFHHGVMEPDDMARASELLALLATHSNVRPRKMSELCP